MKIKEMIVGKMYRRPSWSKGLYITLKEKGEMIRSWTREPRGYKGRDVYVDFYECDNKGEKIQEDKSPKIQTFDNWVDGMIYEGLIGRQSGNECGFYRYLGITDNRQEFGWFYYTNHTPDEVLQYPEFVAKYANRAIKWLEEDFTANAVKQNKSHAVTNSKEEEMKKDNNDVTVEVKVNGKVVSAEARSEEKVKVIKYRGFIYDGNDELQYETGFYSKKEALAEMQKPKNLGCTIELFKRHSTLTTKIPVVEVRV